jgi:hypothetical protein
MNRFPLTIIIGVCITVFFGACSSTREAKPPVETRLQGEVPPTFYAEDILPPEIISSASYTIAKEVPVTQYRYQFLMKSDYGEIPALGSDVLDLRLRELDAIAKAELVIDDPAFFKGVVSPIANTFRGLGLLLTHPFSTIGSLPKGIGMQINQYTNDADRRAGSAVRRKIALDIGADPETENPVLKGLLDSMANRSDAGSFLTRAGMFFVPGADALALSAETKDLLEKQPPSEINKQIVKELEEAGISEDVRKDFIKTPYFSTLQKLQFMEEFRQLSGIADREVLVDMASNVIHEPEALSFLYMMKQYVEMNAHMPITDFKPSCLPVVVSGNGLHTVVLGLDFINLTVEVEDAIRDYRAMYPNEKTIFKVKGIISEKTHQAFVTANISVVTGS